METASAFTCQRCGKCCQQERLKDYWLKSDIAEQRKVQLIKQRQQYPDGKGCRMLVFEGNLATCLMQKLFGFEAKPKGCQDSPIGEPQNFCFWYRKYILGMQDE